MADRSVVISFDEGVEILCGPAAAYEMHARRTQLHLSSLGLGRREARTPDLPALKRLAPGNFGDVLDALDAMDDPWAARDAALGITSKGLVSEVYDF